MPKPRYRYQNPGLHLWRSADHPRHPDFNKSRTKLFFFFSEDFLHSIQTGGVSSYNMPTALERSGDFSQTVTTTGLLIPIKDPTTGQPYPGNKMPASQISPIGVCHYEPVPAASPRGLGLDPTGGRRYNFRRCHS